MSETVRIDAELKSPIDRVWRALTDSETLSQWMMFKTNDFKPVVGHTFRFSDAQGWDGAVDCEVLEVDEPNKLSYSWVSDQVGPSNIEQTTVVTWTLSEVEGGITKLHLEQSGFNPDAKQEIGGAKHGWQYMLAELEKTLG